MTARTFITRGLRHYRGAYLGVLNRDQGVTLIVVTHNADLARRMGQTFELRAGKLWSAVAE